MIVVIQSDGTETRSEEVTVISQDLPGSRPLNTDSPSDVPAQPQASLLYGVSETSSLRSDPRSPDSKQPPCRRCIAASSNPGTAREGLVGIRSGRCSDPHDLPSRGLDRTSVVQVKLVTYSGVVGESHFLQLHPASGKAHLDPKSFTNFLTGSTMSVYWAC